MITRSVRTNERGRREPENIMPSPTVSGGEGIKQDAVGDGRLRPGAAIWRTGLNIRVFDRYWPIRSIM